MASSSAARRIGCAAAAASLIPLLGGCHIQSAATQERSSQTTTGTNSTPDGDRSNVQDISRLLDQVGIVKNEPPSVPGYDLECGRSHGCVFGPRWTDNHDADGGHDGCGTRDNVLARQLSSVTFKPGTNGCVVIAGHFTDPYSGEVVHFTKEKAAEVPVDHIYSRRRAWDMGAYRWPQHKRVRFANDPRNLVATTRAANSSKQDAGLTWLPDADKCGHTARYLRVAVAYDLPITTREHRMARLVISSCSGERP